MIRFRFSLPWLALASCSQAPDFCPSTELSAATYHSSDKCWISERGEFQALVALSETNSGYVPTFISLNCKNLEYGPKEILSLSDFRTPILYSGASLEENRFADLRKPILSNFPIHKVGLDRADAVFFVRSEISFFRHNSVKEVKFTQVKEFRNIGKSLGELLDYRSDCWR